LGLGRGICSSASLPLASYFTFGICYSVGLVITSFVAYWASCYY